MDWNRILTQHATKDDIQMLLAIGIVALLFSAGIALVQMTRPATVVIDTEADVEFGDVKITDAKIGIVSVIPVTFCAMRVC